MTKRRLSTLIIAITAISLLGPIHSSVSAVGAKSGQACSKVGSTQTVAGKKFTCIKNGKKFTWDKGVEALTFNSVCDIDPGVPTEWAKYQQFAKQTFGCARPYRFLDVALPTTKPAIELTPAAERNSLDSCRLPAQRNYNQVGHNIGGWKFNGDLQIQVIPVEFTDFKSASTPEKEYKKYLDYIKNMYFKLSDGNVRITFKTPQEYLKVGSSLESFVTPGEISKNNGRFTWKNINVSAYKNAVYRVADSALDFTNIDMSIVIVPLSVPAEYIPHNQGYRMDNVSTSEGTVEYNYLMPPATAVDDMSWFGVEPFLHLHEFFHANGLLGDHAGDDMGRSGPDLGTGAWGHMSGMMTDFIVWDKWISGMIRDNQIVCVKPNQTSVNWIRPASYFGEFEKLIVIPLSNTKAIAIESERAAGLNFKLPLISQGALVYVLDTTISTPEGGINVIRPSQRTGSVNGANGFVLADAPLKNGESLMVEGHKITVVKAGAFGDVIKVEKASN